MNISVFKLQFVFVFLLISFFILPTQVQAVSTSWNDTLTGTFEFLYYGFNANSLNPRWTPIMSNPNITITYEAEVVNRDTGTVVENGGTVPVGSVLEFTPKAYEDTDIYWFATGISFDSPYGHWQSGAQFPPESNVPYTGDPLSAGYPTFGDAGVPQSVIDESSCLEQDYLTNNGIYTDYFVPLSVEPPPVTIEHGGTAELACDTQGTVCTVESPGSIDTRFVFDDTFGKFYFRYNHIKWKHKTVVVEENDVQSYFPSGGGGGSYLESNQLRLQQFFIPNQKVHAQTQGGGKTYSFEVNNPFCTGDTTPMRFQASPGLSLNHEDEQVEEQSFFKIVGTMFDRLANSIFQRPVFAQSTASDGTFVLDVPEQHITYTISAGDTDDNSPPNPPTINGPTTGVTGVDYTFGFEATDPDGDTIRYGIDWDRNGTVDQWAPLSGFVTSGTSKSAQKVWSTVGTKIFQARTQDSVGLLSGWTTHAITLTEAPGGGQPQCSDTLDNDGDGFFDYPSDPGCSSPLDNSEQDAVTQCSDGVDNDGDGNIDLNDADCFSSADDSEGSDGGADPVVDIFSIPDVALVRQGDLVTIAWLAQDVISCVISGPGISASGDGPDVNGQQEVVIEEQSIYTIVCDTTGAQIQDTLTIKVVPAFKEI